jgi:hypothetical protein
LKRVLVHVSGLNLGLVMRRLIGVGTPRGLQGRLAALIALRIRLWWTISAAVSRRPQLWGDVGDSTATLEARCFYAIAC